MTPTRIVVAVPLDPLPSASGSPFPQAVRAATSPDKRAVARKRRAEPRCAGQKPASVEFVMAWVSFAVVETCTDEMGSCADGRVYSRRGLTGPRPNGQLLEA